MPPRNQLASQTRENSSPIFRKKSTSVKQPKTAAQIIAPRPTSIAARR